MRQFVFALSFVFLFVQSMQPAYALAPLGVLGATFRAGGAFLKGSKFVKGTNYAFAGATMAWCAKNKKKCLDLGEDIAEKAIEHEESKSDDDQDDGSGCIVRFGDDKKTLSALIADNTYEEETDTVIKSYSPDVSRLETTAKNAISRASKNNTSWTFVHGYFDIIITTKNKKTGDSRTAKSTRYAKVNYKCGGEKLKDDLMKKVQDKISDDDAQDIINNYYKNEVENTFNIEQYCATSNSCLDIDNDFSKELNTKDYDYTKVSKENCEVENDKIVSCEKAKKTKSDNDDDSDNTNQDDKKDKDDDSDDTNNSHNTDKKDDDSDNQEIKCNSSEFHKKVCDFIDWYQDDDLDNDDDTKVKVKDLSDDLSIDDDRIKFGRSCPSGPVVSISFKMVNINYQISYEGLCQAFEKMRPFVIGIGGLVSVMIIGGRRV